MATQPMSDGGLADVFETMEEPEAWIVKGLLETAGIPALVTGVDAPPDILPGVGGVMVRVPEEKAAEARSIISEYHRRGRLSQTDSASESP